MNSHLVPKVLTDKNGVVTTRMVKPDASSKSTRIPRITFLKDASTNRSKNRKFVSDKLSKVSEWEVNVDFVVRCSQQMADETLALLAQRLKTASKERTDDIARWVEGMEEKQIREILFFLDAFEGEADPGFVEEVIEYLHQYPGIPQNDLSAATLEEQELCRRFIAVADATYRERYDKGTTDCNPLLEIGVCELVAERPDDLDRIIDIIKVRKVDTGDRIRLFLDTDSPDAIAEGIL